MRKLLLTTLLAAASIAPSIASAQDNNGGERHGWGGNRGQADAGRAGGFEQSRNDGGQRPQFLRPQPQAAAPVQQPAPQNFERPQRPQFQPQANSGQPNFQANGGWQGRERGQGGFGQGAQAPSGQQSGQASGSWQGRGWQDRGWQGDRGQRPDQFRNNGGGAPTPAPVIRDGDRGQRNWNNGDRNRGAWNGNNGFGNRGNGYRPNYDQNRRWDNDRGWDRDHDRGRWNNGWRGNNRYDWRGYRSYNRDVFRLPRYYAPYGWGYGYQRYSIGVRLNSLLFSQSYWIDDPAYYRLPDAYGPYRWVRYYNDALLVDIYSGEVVDVVYDIFW